MKNIYLQAGNQGVQIKESNDIEPKIIIEGPAADESQKTYTYPSTDVGKVDAKDMVTEMIANGVSSESAKGHDFIDQL